MPNRKQFIIASILAIAGGVAWLALPKAPTPGPPLVLPRAEVVRRDGVLVAKSGGGAPFTGLMVETSTAGARLSEIPVLDGVVHGVAKGWHENGQLETEETFVKGVSHGIRTQFHPNGRKKTQAHIKMGKLHGPYSEWHPNGQQALLMRMEDDLAQGSCEAWHADGGLKSRTLLKDGKPVQTEFTNLAANPRQPENASNRDQ